MTATVIKLPEPQQRAALKMQCSACGVTADAACDCGAPYQPVSARAAQAIAENPEKSNRAIAAELGVSKDSVRKAREAGGYQSPPADKRVGRDGKSYPAAGPSKGSVKEKTPPENYHAAFSCASTSR
jgi:hypothetical protein